MIETLFYIILVILAFIFVVISQTIIEDQSTVIGTLLASGYTKNELTRHYMALPIIITFLSAVIGNIQHTCNNFHRTLRTKNAKAFHDKCENSDFVSFTWG